MNDENLSISKKTWKKSIDVIVKERYADGVVDGESSMFQSSFDMGYEEGLRYGLNLGYNTAFGNNMDIQKHNCTICADQGNLKENVTNLCYLQRQKNMDQ